MAKVVITLGSTLALLLIFGWTILYMIRSERKSRESKLQISRALGFTPLDPTPRLTLKITQLYRRLGLNRYKAETEKYRLENVSSKQVPDGELLIFDLIDTAAEDESYTENQAVAMISPHLDLPAFMIFPKSDVEGTASSLANKALAWVFSKVGNPVSFPQVQAFENRYLVSSPKPDEVWQFLDERKLTRFAKTRLVSMYAGGDLFTLSRLDMVAKPPSREGLTERLNQSLEILSIFLS